ncbi:MAG: hypothetical protein LBS19_06135 [Clostridiales bacterium]|nr:hypothetical protein [Clostridiales bacterium]
MKINWKQKLSSRKFWAALIGYLTALLAAFNFTENVIAQVTAVVTAVGSLVAYLLAEAHVDAKRAEENRDKDSPP